MVACHGQGQREGEVTHVITDRLEDLSKLLRRMGERDGAFLIRHRHREGATHPVSRDLRDGLGISVPTRDFR